MTDSNQPDEFEHFSLESRQQLHAAATALATALERHTAALLEMRGGPNDLLDLLQSNDDIRRAAVAWDDAVFDHTGTFPIAVESFDDDADAEDEDEDGAPDAADTPLVVSVVSRWDLDVIDPTGLVRAGQAAHLRLNPSQSETDAEADIDGVGPALHAIAHEHGEPWLEIAGVGMVSGHRVYVRRDDDEPLTEAFQDYDQPPVAPTGEVIFSESW